MSAPFELEPLEQACGVVLGAVPGPPVARAPRGVTARAALEAEILGHLAQSPCAVSFSGGRDSSAVLAVAAHVARREGLPLPVPITFRFPGLPEADESEWQESVLAHLGLTNWEHVDLTDELDLLGDVAQQCLRAHGITWPPNAYLHMPLFALAQGGVILTGLDGDGLFGDWRWCHAQAVLHRTVPAHPRDVIRIGLAFAPAAVRARALGGRSIFAPSWLRPSAAEEFRAQVVVRAAGEPRRWDRRTLWHERSRALHVTMASLEVLADAAGSSVAHPFLSPPVIGALAQEGGAAGFGSRTSAMHHLFGDLLPAAVIERQSKAVFGGAVWSERARAFATSWSGSGVDPSLVDHDLLRVAWAESRPVFHSWTLLQAAWLAAQPPSTTSN
jgi:asparagine synthase (glutamine-hydrolysing)